MRLSARAGDEITVSDEDGLREAIANWEETACAAYSVRDRAPDG